VDKSEGFDNIILIYTVLDSAGVLLAFAWGLDVLASPIPFTFPGNDITTVPNPHSDGVKYALQ
jgi:hypothetical protein